MHVKKIDTMKQLEEDNTVETILGGYLAQLDIQSRVLIKPNLCWSTDPQGARNTDIRLVQLILKVLQDLYGSIEIFVLESDSTGKKIKEAYRNLGFKKLSKLFGVRLVDLTAEKSSEVATLSPAIRGNIKLPNLLLKGDPLISIPKLKNHKLTGITGCLKNQFGLLPDPDKMKFHSQIDEVIVAINKVVKPDLCVVDGIISMLNGPVHGKAIPLSTLVVDKDPIPIDTFGCNILNINPNEVGHLILAKRHNLGKQS